MKKREDTMTLQVSLNGTDENPWHKFGLVINPFPQVAKFELMGAMRQLAQLGGPPIPKGYAEEHIRKTLSGWSDEFVSLCVRNYREGEYVKFSVTFPYEGGH